MDSRQPASTSNSMIRNVHPPNRKPHVLLAATGAVTASTFHIICYKIAQWADVKAVATRADLNFMDVCLIPRNVVLYTDGYALSLWSERREGLLHVELPKWADILVIAPLSANALAKIASGLCDSLLTSIVREWDYNKPAYVTPPMNTSVWKSPLTERQMTVLREFGMKSIPPLTGTGPAHPIFDPYLICGLLRMFANKLSSS